MMTLWQLNKPELRRVRCRFGCDEEPIGIYHVPGGCACFPDPVQALCAQHVVTISCDGFDLLVALATSNPDKRAR